MKSIQQSLTPIIDKATKLHVANINNTQNYSLDELYALPIQIQDTALSELVKKHDLTFQEQVIFLLALAPWFAPQALDIFRAKNPNFDIICTEFGGVTQSPHRGVIPTGETAVFLLAGRDTKRRKEVANLLLPDSKLARNNLLDLETATPGLPVFSGKLIPNEDLVQILLYGEVKPPKISPSFPAQQLTTEMTWADLIIPQRTREQLEDLENWLKFFPRMEAHPELGKRVRKGYRTLFYGPPGTGKTLTASLLGKSADRPVFRIDLSFLVSKYIGETEKNLAGIFKRAEHKSWILFFDEADALFSKRTETESSNDRFANQEVAYLLQRIENYNGMVILASNLKENMDTAFLRRFQSMIHFPKPGKLEREQIWKKTIPRDLPLSKDIDQKKLVERYEITASQISNIVQACFIEAMAKGQSEITRANLIKNMRTEFRKEDLLFEDLI